MGSFCCNSNSASERRPSGTSAFSAATEIIIERRGRKRESKVPRNEADSISTDVTEGGESETPEHVSACGRDHDCDSVAVKVMWKLCSAGGLQGGRQGVDAPCLLRLFSMFEELPERLSMELECVHWDRRDWGWGGSFRDRPPTSMQFTFMFGFSPAAHRNNRTY